MCVVLYRAADCRILRILGTKGVDELVPLMTLLDWMLSRKQIYIHACMQMNYIERNYVMELYFL